MGVWLKKSVHGHGFGKEAMTAIKKWADDNLDYDYILYQSEQLQMDFEIKLILSNKFP